MPAPDQLGLWQDRRTPLDLRYAAWRATTDGQDVFAAVERLAMNARHAGERRIEINLLFAQVRQRRKKAADNSFRALIARELIGRHPELAGLIHVKKRKSEAAA